MPTYDYQCQACQREFTAQHKINDSAPVCPQCGGSVRKKLSAPAIHGGGSRPSALPPPVNMGAGHGCGTGGCGCKH